MKMLRELTFGGLLLWLAFCFGVLAWATYRGSLPKPTSGVLPEIKCSCDCAGGCKR